jgi:hypothetical protein
MINVGDKVRLLQRRGGNDQTIEWYPSCEWKIGEVYTVSAVKLERFREQFKYSGVSLDFVEVPGQWFRIDDVVLVLVNADKIKVKCIDNDKGYLNNITIGAIYLAEEWGPASRHYSLIDNSGVEILYSRSRFEIVKDEVPEPAELSEFEKIIRLYNVLKDEMKVLEGEGHGEAASAIQRLLGSSKSANILRLYESIRSI